MTIKEKMDVICKAIAEKKGVQIRMLHVTELTSVADYFVIATVRNTKQAQAAADEVEEKMEASGDRPLRSDGYREGNWILLDFADVIVHIFTDEEIRRYELDHLWGDAPVTEYHEGEEEKGAE